MMTTVWRASVIGGSLHDMLHNPGEGHAEPEPLLLARMHHGGVFGSEGALLGLPAIALREDVTTFLNAQRCVRLPMVLNACASLLQWQGPWVYPEGCDAGRCLFESFASDLVLQLALARPAVTPSNSISPRHPSAIPQHSRKSRTSRVNLLHDLVLELALDRTAVSSRFSLSPRHHSAIR